MTLFMNKHLNKMMVASGILIVIGLLFLFLGFTNIRNITFIVATIVAIGPILVRAFNALMVKSFSIELLISIAVIAALLIQEYTEAAVVSFLFLFGAYLEKRTLEKTSQSIQSLLEMEPMVAYKLINGEEVEIDVDDVEIGDHLIVRPGSQVPVDGIVVNGSAQMNEAAITGESVTRHKMKDDEVFSGTIIENGYLEIEATKIGADSTFSKIIELVEDATSSKSKTEKFLNKFAQYYTPSVVVLSILVYFITKNVHLAITFLVIACPGALIIGAPVAYVAGLGNASKKSVLIKGGAIIDQFAKVKTVIFDKTGTLTEGKPSVTRIHSLTDIKEEQLLKEVAAVERVSEHHLGRTIIEEAVKRGLDINIPVVDMTAIKARGVSGVIDDMKYLIGNERLMTENNVPITNDTLELYENEQKLGQTVMFISKDSEIVGLISIMDKIKSDAKATIDYLRNQGVEKIVMLTGDNYFAAEKVSEILGIDEFHAELLPEDKLNYIENEQKTNRTLMVGDGINDAPALAMSNVGLAIGHKGTDIAMETADVVLMGERLRNVAYGFALSKQTFNIMIQNTAVALLTVVLLLFGVIYGYIHLASGMLIHELSILVVILNAMRLMRYNDRENVHKNVEFKEDSFV
ncbi:heavy metal translocating P-type ATPase [Phocicoccus pinnipedialis]|uniref:Cd(2+)-exporting ATPase n=1 Tax=Phocicoccus pinnipedialis TaxID=110845 RepID=A0A6V7R4X8_9BACL|nr:heavy metal translocating P-type ATPase [Jeotgalicoccus pinnipedialis]MBP1939984.1 Cd2+/Zn2+-exporting ATPase [Jeotgalicoccus pinnipedialis]CAD2072068.1 putative cadmium-transporting ATPase [Jeotgalicoccus pinnipedialis]